jgi:hypothetical protein
LADTDATQALTATGLPAVASTSSIPSEPSLSADQVAALGERILAELDAVHTNSTLTRWLAHHTAALIEAADQAHAAAAPDADARAADARAAILQLWQHRSDWPGGWPPPRAAEIVRLLEELPDLGDLPWHRVTTLARLHDLHHHILAVLVDLAIGRGGDIEEGWLETFGDLLNSDETALLARASTTEQRLSRLFSWRAGIEPEPDAGETEIGSDDANDAESAATPPELLAALADTYRQTVIGLFGLARDNGRSEDADNAASPGCGTDEADGT